MSGQIAYCCMQDVLWVVIPQSYRIQRDDIIEFGFNALDSLARLDLR